MLRASVFVYGKQDGLLLCLHDLTILPQYTPYSTEA
jgi:hypothetical protein